MDRSREVDAEHVRKILEDPGKKVRFHKPALEVGGNYFVRGGVIEDDGSIDRFYVTLSPEEGVMLKRTPNNYTQLNKPEESA